MPKELSGFWKPKEKTDTETDTVSDPTLKSDLYYFINYEGVGRIFNIRAEQSKSVLTVVQDRLKHLDTIIEQKAGFQKQIFQSQRALIDGLLKRLEKDTTGLGSKSVSNFITEYNKNQSSKKVQPPT